MYREQKRADREKLYQEVWSTPMLQLAKQYSYSDRGLAKLCERMNIPVPPRGYWAKKEAGQEVAQTPLPPLSEGQQNYVIYRAMALEPSSPKDQSLEEFEHRPENRITVADEAAELHPLAARINQALEKAEEEPIGDSHKRRGVVWCDTSEQGDTGKGDQDPGRALSSLRSPRTYDGLRQREKVCLRANRRRARDLHAGGAARSKGA